MLRRFLPMFFLLLFFFAAYWAKAAIFLDPDFGWHIRMGQIILTKGIPATDQLSYTMPNYPVIDHEWLTNVLIAYLYPSIGYVGLAFIFALLTVGALFLQIEKKQPYTMLPLLLAGSLLLSFTGIRPQVISWFLFSLLIKILLHKQLSKKHLIVVPCMFLLWTNMHGGFAYGIAAVGIAAGTSWIKRRNILNKQLLILLACLFVTVINPYGFRIWQEIFMQATDTQLRGSLQEWKSAFQTVDYLFWLFFVFAIILIWKYRTVFHLTQHGLFAFFLIYALFGIRHIPFWLFVAIPMVATAVTSLQKEAAKITYGTKRFALVYRYVVVLCLLLVLPYLFINKHITILLSEQRFYPRNAIAYLHNHVPKEHLFAPQEWNGYIVWKLPEQKVFIHGMMPSWRNFYYKGNSPYAFREYRNLLSGKQSLKQTVAQYTIDTILLPNKNVDNALLKQQALQKQVESLNWRKVYADDIAVIYKKDDY